MAEGRLAPVIDTVYPLAEIQRAARRTADRDIFGKMVLVP